MAGRQYSTVALCLSLLALAVGGTSLLLLRPEGLGPLPVALVPYLFMAVPLSAALVVGGVLSAVAGIRKHEGPLAVVSMVFAAISASPCLVFVLLYVTQVGPTGADI